MYATVKAFMPKNPKRNDLITKVDAQVLRMARLIAAYEDIPISELLSEILRPALEKRLEKHKLPHPVEPKKPAKE